MRIPRLLILPLLTLACVVPAATQSLVDRNPSQPVLSLSESSQAGIRVDQFQLPFRGDRNDLSRSTPTDIGAGQSASIISPLQLHKIPSLESREIASPAQDDICYSIRGYRVTRDNPESDSTRLAGYSTCQRASRFHVKSAADLRETVIR